MLGWKPQTQAEDADGSGSCEEIVIAFDSQFVGLKTVRPLKRFVSSKVGHCTEETQSFLMQDESERGGFLLPTQESQVTIQSPFQ